MAHTAAERYRIPQAFAEAHARGFAGLPLVPNADALLDPVTGRPVPPGAYSHETVREAIEEAGRRHGIPCVRMWCAIERRDPEAAGAYYCPETNECVFLDNTSAVACAKEFGAGRPVEALAPEDYRRFIEGTAQRMLGRLWEARPTPRPT